MQLETKLALTPALPQEREKLWQLVNEPPIGLFERDHQNRTFRLRYDAAPEDGRTPNCIVPAQEREDLWQLVSESAIGVFEPNRLALRTAASSVLCIPVSGAALALATRER